jgi:hypothetical protein
VRARDFRAAIARLAAEGRADGTVVAAGPGGLYDVVAVRAWQGDVLLEICKREGPVPVTRRPRRKRATA